MKIEWARLQFKWWLHLVVIVVNHHTRVLLTLISSVWMSDLRVAEMMTADKVTKIFDITPY